tara:strand:+ start:1268 stop:2161 length:894 start_codon:yes stop_codon:yes gene_type:complete
MEIGFSIIMPNYNSLFIERAIKSVIDQTFNIWELIIIDNYSENFPDKLLERFNDKRINFYKFRNNNNIAKSRNYGITKAKYDWIAFLDSDDVWEPKKLIEVKKVLDKKNFDLIYHAMYYLPKSLGFIKKKISNLSNYIEEPIFDTLVKNGNGIANSSVVVKKEKLINIDLISEKNEKFSWEDFDCWLRLALKKNKFYFINKSLGYIWTGSGRVSNDRQLYTNSKNFIKVYKNSITDILGKTNKRPMWILYIYANYFFKKKQYFKSFYFMKCVKEKSFKLKIKYIIAQLMIFFKKRAL